MSTSSDKSPSPASPKAVGQFLDQVRRTPVKAGDAPDARLMFAMDATASREPTWDSACHIQGQMFEATQGMGDLAVQLCHYRGFRGFHAGPWCANASELLAEMSGVRCLGGHTQIGRVLDHAMAEHRRHRIRALVFVGDAMEEDADALCHKAGQLGVMNVPLFMFQEGGLAPVERVFRQMAQLSGGSYAPFDLGSANQLRDLLRAVAIYAVGGASALENFSKGSSSEVKRLARQINP